MRYLPLRMRPLITGLAIAAMAATAVALTTASSHAAPPSFFTAVGSGFGEGSTAYSLRFAGANRFDTAGAAALVSAVDQDSTTGWPFNQPDFTDPAKAYGAHACPGTVFIAASDGLPDALAAAPLWGLKGLSTLPNDSHSYDTSDAVLLLTDSARAGATHLNADTAAVLKAIKAACTNGFDAVILGGPAAVASGVADDLKALANNVGRVGGVDRFDTAAQIATAVHKLVGLGSLTYYSSNTSNTGTQLAGTVLLAEGFTGADALAVGPIAAEDHIPVLLAQNTDVIPPPGQNYHNLPPQTNSALASFAPQHIVALGGPTALPTDILGGAYDASGTKPGIVRISGDTRYGTSVAIAEQLDDLWPANATNSQGQDQDAFDNQGFGLARSEGGKSQQLGWPDALASGFVLANLHSHATVPQRLGPPIEADQNGQCANPNDNPVSLGGVPPAHKSPTPLLLTPEVGLDPEVHAFLSGLYPVSANMVTMSNPPASCAASSSSGSTTTTLPTPSSAPTDDGGFVYVFGGDKAVSPTAEDDAAKDVSGGTYAGAGPTTDITPKLDFSTSSPGTVFYTGTDLTTYQTGYTPGSSGSAATTKPGTNGDGGIDPDSAYDHGSGGLVCAMRNALSGVALLDVVGADSAGPIVKGVPVPYESPGQGFPANQNQPFCIDVSGFSPKKATVVGVSLSGNVTPGLNLDWSDASKLLTTSTAGAAKADDGTNGTTKGSISPSGQSIFNEAIPNNPTVLKVNYTGVSIAGSNNGNQFTSGNLDLTLTRSDVNFTPSNSGTQIQDPITCTGTFTFSANGATVTANINAENATDPTPQNKPNSTPGFGADGPIACVGDYTIGSATGAVHFTLTQPPPGMSQPDDGTHSSLSDLMLDGMG